MVNSWSLLYDEMYEPNDEDTVKISDTVKNLPKTDDVTGIFEYPPEHITGDNSMSIGECGSVDGYDPLAQNFLADNDDNAAHHFNYEELNLNIHANSPYNDGWTQQAAKEELKNMSDARNKYHEKEILKDIEDYVSGTYNGHYTGTKHEYRNVQTIDLMASRDLASDFCQANILKYGSRYGSKDGKNRKDLMKVIHYAMLLLHFDEHYGKPSITSGNIDHNMP